PDNQILFRGVFSKTAKRCDYAVEALLRLNGPPIGKYANDSRAHPPCDLEGARRQPGLIFKTVLGSENILLKSRVDLRHAWQHALQKRRRDRNYFHPFGRADLLRAIQLLIAEIDDVLSK